MFRSTKLRSYIAALLLAAVLAVGVCPPAYARQTDFFPDIAEVAGDYSFADFTYNEPDDALFYTLQERVLLMNDLQNREELMTALARYAEEYSRLQAASMLAMYQYYCQPQARAAFYQEWQSMLAGVERDYLATWRELAASANRPMLDELLSPMVMAYYDGTPEVSDELLALNRQIQALDSAYWQAVDKDYRVTYQGREYGFADLPAITDADTYLAVYKLLAQARNAETAGLLAAIVPVANRYAQGLGYSDYAAYAYREIYDRDYSPEQAARLHELVKQYIVPLYGEVLAVQNNNARFDQAALNAKGDLSGTELLAILGQYLPEVSDEYAEAFAYMQSHGLADVTRDGQKLAASFTSYISYYRLALLFIGSQTGTAHDLATLVHEFGHFAYYMYQQQDIGYDVGEFYSQALELLFLHFAGDIFGEDGATYRLNELANQLAAIVDGCLYDEFQQRLYRLENPTVAELNRLFHELSLEYGYAYVHDDEEAYNWVTTAHTFIQPFYYMSYAVSGLSACELLGRSREDFAAAADDYLAMTLLHESDYRAFANEAGLADIFSEDGMRQITEGLRAYLYEDICGLAALDEVSAHWAAKPLLLAVRLGWLNGDGQGLLLPDQAINRAEAFALLWRFMGSEQAQAAGSFPDVPAGAWYEQAAGWARVEGLSNGSDGGNFYPAQPLTREELVTVLYRLNRKDVDGLSADTAVLAGFADAAEVADWARQPFAWAVQNGIVSGTDDNRLAPKQAATRAEMAALLAGLVK